MAARRVPVALPLLSRATNPAILPIPSRRHGNNVPHSLHKTRRTWRANVKRFDLPVNVLADAPERSAAARTAAESKYQQMVMENGYKGPRASIKAPQLKGVKMLASDIKDVGKAGGIEGVLLSRPGSHFTKFGRTLRHSLFADLHRIRAEVAETAAADRIEAQSEVERVAAGQTPQVADR